MPQGKLKVKTKLPSGIKNKGIVKKRDQHFQKKNRPALPKKNQNQLREQITKSINEHNETAAKEKACMDGGNKFRVITTDAEQHQASSSKKKH